MYCPDKPGIAIVRLAETEEWSADAYESDPLSTSNRNIPEGQTQVDSFRFDGTGASGDAAFVDLDNLTYHQDGGFYSGEPVSGTFEVACG